MCYGFKSCFNFEHRSGLNCFEKCTKVKYLKYKQSIFVFSENLNVFIRPERVQMYVIKENTILVSEKICPILTIYIICDRIVHLDLTGPCFHDGSLYN